MRVFNSAEGLQCSGIAGAVTEHREGAGAAGPASFFFSRGFILFLRRAVRVLICCRDPAGR